jgi:hypothetical protein
VIGSGGKNDHPPSDGRNGPPSPPPPTMAGVGKARATGTVTVSGTFVYSGTLVVSSNSKLVVSTQFLLMADWASLLTWNLSSSTEVPIMTGTTFSHNAELLVTDGTASAMPTLDVAAMQKRGMMKYMYG